MSTAGPLIIKVRLSPDLRDIIKYIDALGERLNVCDRWGDPLILPLRAELSALRPGDLFEFDSPEDGSFMLTPSDRLLEVIAKFRAVERVIYSRRL